MVATYPDANIVAPSRVAADVDGDGLTGESTATFTNTGKEFLWITNAGGSSTDLTITTQKTIDGEAVADKVVALGAGETHCVGPFPTEIYNDGNNEVTLTMGTGFADVTLWVIRPTT